MKHKNIIFPAHSMDTSFYAMTPDGDLVSFFTGESGILPENYPTYDELKDYFAKVVRSCINDQNIKREIKRVKTQMGEDHVIDSLSSEILSRFEYQYDCDMRGEVVENILKGDLDFTGTVHRYMLSKTPTLKSERVRKAIKKYLGKLLPIIKPKKVIRFESGESYNDEVIFELISLVTHFLTDLGNFWSKLTERFGENFRKTGFIALINTKLIPEMLRTRLSVEYPDSKILKDPGVYFVNLSRELVIPDDDLDIARTILKIKDNNMKKCVIFIKSVDELLDFYQNLQKRR